jgi:hypothetical protein
MIKSQEPKHKMACLAFHKQSFDSKMKLVTSSGALTQTATDTINTKQMLFSVFEVLLQPEF